MTKAKTRSARNDATEPDPETYQVGEWAGHPNYGCPFCPVRSLEGTAWIVAHIAQDHREQAIQTAPQEA